MSQLLTCTYGASSGPPSMAARKSRGSRPSARAPATAWATPAVTMKTHELHTSFSRLPAPAGPSHSVFEPIASHTGATRSRASSGPEARTTSAPLLGRLLGAQHRRVDQHEVELAGGPDGPRRAVDTDGGGLQPDSAGGRGGPADHVVHRVDVEHHGQDDVGAVGRLGGRVARLSPGAGQRAGLGGVAVPHPHRQTGAPQRAVHAGAHRSGTEHRDHRGRRHEPILALDSAGRLAEAFMDVHVRLLGGFEVVVDRRAVPDDAWRRRAAAALVKLLALAPGHRLLRERVTDALWPDLLLDDALPRLHTAAHHARAALGSRDAVVLEQGAVALFPGGQVRVDVEEFERAADAARDGGAEAAAAAADRYPGDLLPDDPYEPWTELPREHLRRRRLEVLHQAGRLEELVDADPLDEQPQLALARQHLAHGRWQAALRGLDRMAEVFRAELGVEPGPAAAALRREAARAAGGRRTRLPPPRTRLIGRDDDVAAVESLLRTSRVVTVTGPGGAGKSTLALAVRRRYRPDGEADVLLAELAPVRDRAGLVRAVAEAAGVQGEGAVAPARLAALLATRPVLLLLDNCEHLLDATAELVDAVLDAGPRVRIVPPSREPLRIDGEVVHGLGPLGAEAAELFVERATAAAGPGVAAVGDPRVAELCRRLDGLPLAIELAAAQLVHLDLDELVARLDDRLTLLAGTRPRAGVRHSALGTTVEWSHQLLTPESRDLFARLGIFPAGFDLAAVQAVAGGADPGAVPRLLGDLVAKSLVVHDPVHRRYRLLETLRLFAAARLDDAGLRPEVGERLRSFAVARARELPRTRRWLSAVISARSRDDLDTVRLAFAASLAAGDPTAAVALALGLATLWRNAVSYAEGRRWVDALLAGDLAPRDRMWALVLDAD